MVTLDVYDLQGRKITSLVHGEQDAGNYAVGFSANDPKTGNLPSGVYFYRFQAGALPGPTRCSSRDKLLWLNH